MCFQVRRHYHCGHEKVHTIQCAAANTFASMGNAANQSSRNIPSLSDDHALTTQFLLTQCMKQCDLPTEDQKSSKLCETCNETSSVQMPGSDRDFSDAAQLAVGINDSKPMKWTDEHGNIWDVRDETKASRPPPPPKNGADDGGGEELVRPSEMSLYDPVNFKWADKEGNELTTLEEKQNLAKDKPGMFAAMKAPGQKRSISSLNGQYQSAMHQSFLAAAPEKTPRPWSHPGSSQRTVSTGSSLLSAFQSMTSVTSSAPPLGPTPKRSLAEKVEYYTDKAEAGMPESPKTVDEARKKYEVDRDAAKNAEMTIEEWRKWKYEAEQAAAEHESMTSPPKMAARAKMRAVDRRAAARRAAARCAAANDRIYGLGASKTSSSTTSAPRPTIDEQMTTAKEKITAIVLKLSNDALTPDESEDDESSPRKRRTMSNLHTAALSVIMKNSEESMMSTPKTSGDFQCMTEEEESTSSLLSSTDESIISAPDTGDQDTIIVKKSASSVIGSDNGSIISSPTATGNQRTIFKKKSASNLLSTVQEENPDPRPVVASLEADIAAVKNKLASMPPTVTFSNDEDKEVDAPEVMSKNKKKGMKEKAKKARAAAVVEVAAETDKKSLNSILEPTRVQKRVKENKKAYNARAASLAASAQALKDSNYKYPLGQGKARPAEEPNSATDDWPPGGAPVPWAPAALGHELDGLNAAFAAARVRIAARKAAENEAGLDSSSKKENIASAPASAPDSPPKRRLGQVDGLKFAGLVGNVFADEKKALLASNLRPTSNDQTVTGKKEASGAVDTPQESKSSGSEATSLNATDGVAEKNLASTQQPVVEGQTVAEKVTEFSKLGAPQEGTSSGPETAAEAVVASKVSLLSCPEEEKNSPSDVVDTPQKSMSSGPEIAAVSDTAAATDVSLPSSPGIPGY